MKPTIHPPAFRSSLGVLVATLGLLGALGVAGLASAGSPEPSRVTSFSPGRFPEGLAISPAGRPFVSVTTWATKPGRSDFGRIVKVTASGGQRKVGPRFDLGKGLLTGLAFDARARLFVAGAAYGGHRHPGVWRVGRHGGATRVLTLGTRTFPNGIAFHRGSLYVSDSATGSIVKLDPGGSHGVWVKSHLLQPRTSFGANGIAFRHHALYVSVTDTGRIVRVPIRASGAPGKPSIAAAGRMLKGADGIAFDRSGRLYVATSAANSLARVSLGGQVERVAGANDGLLYPTTPAFAGPTHPHRLYLVNGDFSGSGRPSLVRFTVRHPGGRLP